MSAPHIQAIAHWLEHQGAQVTGDAVTGGGHTRIMFVFRGQSKSYVASSTPINSVSAALSAISDLRHALGIVGGKVVGERRVHRRRAPARRPKPPETLTCGPDWQRPLLRCLTPDEAWVLFWRQCMADVGGTSLLETLER